MEPKKIKIFFRIYWPQILVMTIGTLLAVAFVTTLIVGIQAFKGTESYFRRTALAGMGFQLYLGLFHAIIFAIVSSAFHYWLYMGGGANKLGGKKVKPEKVSVRWSEIVGMESVKKDVWEVIQLIKDRTRVEEVGGKIIKGVLMMGPPGVGKTYLAKAIATETGLPFLSAVGSEFKGMFVGLGASKIKSMFKEARALAELHGGCLIFIDEIDVIARPRGQGSLGGSHDHDATVNQLLTEMDGLGNGPDNLVILAATNFHDSELDPALMRAGRFDRKISMSLPGIDERKDLLRFYLAKIQYDDQSMDLDRLARLLVGRSPADMNNIVRETALIAQRKRKKMADIEDFHEAHERITLGDKLQIKLIDKDREISAYHEAGKVMITYLAVPTKDVFKASIIPRKSGKGVTWMMEKEERYLFDKEELLGQIKILLGGFAAEKIKFGKTSTAVENDLEMAYLMAEHMVTQWGMGSSGALGISMGPASEKDKEQLINNCLDDVNEILRKEKDLLEVIAQRLIAEDELDFDKLEELFQKKGKSRLTYTIKEEKDKAGGTTWDDIIGMEDAKIEAKEVVQLMRDRVVLQKSGGDFVKGLILFGPPGCGKTYLASAIANEMEVPLISRSGSDFVEMYVGVGAARIRNLFQEAREKATAHGGCIIFIDEIDAVAGKRNMSSAGGGDSERNSTINQILVEMDGVKEKSDEYNIIVIGATNMEEDFLDPALMRPGRFDRKIYVELPNWEDRIKLFGFFLKKYDFDQENVDLEKFASITAGWSPAEISNLVKEANLLMIRKGKKTIGIGEIEEARERIELGLKKRIKISEKEKRETAIHEAGHCIATYYNEPDSPPFKLSIVPRRKSLGVSWEAKKGDHTGSMDAKALKGKIMVYLGGYAAEKLHCRGTSAGVDSDFSGAMNLAHNMVWRWGMGTGGILGNFHSLIQKSPELVSEEMKSRLDRETQEVLKECLENIENLLKREERVLKKLVEELLSKEELNYRELEEIFTNYGTQPNKSPVPSA